MKKKAGSFAVLGLGLIGLVFIAANFGSIQVSFYELIRGLFIEYDEKVTIIFDLRFPRIIIALLSGSAIAVSGALFQAVMKNPLADPGIIGISAAASFAAAMVAMFFPILFFFTPFFAFLGGITAFALVYGLSWKSGLSPLRVILVGVAINAMFVGMLEAVNYMTGGNLSGVAAIVEANISMKTWNDVHLLLWYVVFGLAAAFLIAGRCNMLALEDKTIRNLGVNQNLLRISVSVIAVLLASISTAVAGTVIFVGLIVPHIARLLVGSDHKYLLPFCALCGAFTLLLADTAGRLIAAPYEIPAAIIMAMVGGPFFIFLLRRSDKIYGN